MNENLDSTSILEKVECPRTVGCLCSSITDSSYEQPVRLRQERKEGQANKGASQSTLSHQNGALGAAGVTLNSHVLVGKSHLQWVEIPRHAEIGM